MTDWQQRYWELSAKYDETFSKAQMVVDKQRSRINELEAALNQILAHRYGDWCEIARAALGDTQ